MKRAKPATGVASWRPTRRAFLKALGGLAALLTVIKNSLDLLDRWRAPAPLPSSPVAQAPASPALHQVVRTAAIPIEWQGGDAVNLRDAVTVEVQRAEPSAV